MRGPREPIDMGTPSQVPKHLSERIDFMTSPEATQLEVKVIDAVCNLRTPEIVARQQHEWILYGEQFGRPDPSHTVPHMISCR